MKTSFLILAAVVVIPWAAGAQTSGGSGVGAGTVSPSATGTTSGAYTGSAAMVGTNVATGSPTPSFSGSTAPALPGGGRLDGSTRTSGTDGP